MKILHLKSILFAFMSLFLLTACNNTDEPSLYDDWVNVLNNHREDDDTVNPNFYFDEKGRCYGLGGIGESGLEEAIFGHGWKCYDSWEIDANGFRLKQSWRQKKMFGGSLTDYYFDADGTAKAFYVSDAYPDGRFYIRKTWRFVDDRSQHLTSTFFFDGNENDYLQIIGWSNDVFVAVHPAGEYSYGRKIYAVSLFQRMTDKELEDYNKNYKPWEHR